MRSTFVISVVSLLAGHINPVQATFQRRQTNSASTNTTTMTTSISTTVIATSPPLITGSFQECAIDPVYAGLWFNSGIEYYATSFCLKLLASPTVTSCLSVDTTRETVAPRTTITETTTDTTTVPSSTVTVTTTNMDFRIASDEGEANQPAAITARAYPRIHMQKRQFSNDSYDLSSALASACTCKRLSTPTKNVICTSTSTIYQTTILYTSTTVFVTTTSGIKTVTTTISTTTAIPTTGTVNSTTTWTVPITTTTEDSWGGWNGTSTTSTASSTATPIGCPYNNGTTFSENADECTYYERVCGRSYADSDFYPELIYGGETPEDCTRACDGFNNGKADSCLGLVWSTLDSTANNCRFLKSLTTPVNASDSIALLIRDDPKCKNQTTSTMSSSSMPQYPNTTTSEPYYTTAPPYTTMTYNRTVDMNTTTTSAYNTSYPTTWTGTGTGTGAPPTTSNSTTCAANTLTETTTVYATLYNTVTDATKTVTVTITEEPRVITKTGKHGPKTKHYGLW